MKHAAALLLALAALGPARPAYAQIVTLPPSEAVACMTPSPAERGVPVYPPALLERKEEGKVLVELVFASAGGPPVVKVLTETPMPELVAAVEHHAAKLRVPCLPPGAEPARIQQEYVFRPDDGRPVFASKPRDLGDADRSNLAACLTRIVPGDQVPYPASALRNDVQGNFLLRLRFDSATQPPTLQVLAQPGDASLRRAVTDFVEGYRLPCLKQGSAVLELEYRFKITGSERAWFRDMPLTGLLKAAAFMPLPAQFDFTAMGCPFDVRLSYYQPHKDNEILQVGDAHPARSEFLDWLSQIRLRLEHRDQNALLGHSFDVHVPCAKLNL